LIDAVCLPPANLEWEPDRSAITVTFDDLPGATFGATEVEALARAEDLPETALSFYTDDGRPVPRPMPAKGRPIVIARPLVAAKMALHDAMLAAGVSNVEPGRRLGLDEKSVRRLRDPLHRSHIGQVGSALRLLGKRLEVRVLEAG
jgi:antitoxin HicB